MSLHVKILGARGSSPVSGGSFARYGGATTCILLRFDGEPLLLDAGTGLMQLSCECLTGEGPVPILLSHPHLDHLMGLPCCPLALESGRRIAIYAACRENLTPEQQLLRLMAPPLWPVGPEVMPASFSFHTITGSFRLGAVQVDTMEGIHPGGVSLFRLTCRGSCVVFVTDCTLEEPQMPRFAEFARGCDLLLVDGQYSPEEWEAYRSFGHSTWEMAARLGALCGAKQTRILHHAPSRTDAELDAAGMWLAQTYPNCTFACEGEEIAL